jgi:hypothetical protein
LWGRVFSYFTNSIFNNGIPALVPLTSLTISLLGRQEGGPVYCRLFSSITGLYSLDAHPVVETIKYVSNMANISWRAQ